MANVVLNRLSIFAPAEDEERIIKLFTNENEEVEFSLDKIIPQPKEYDIINPFMVHSIETYLKDKTDENLNQIKCRLEYFNIGMSIHELFVLYNDILKVIKSFNVQDWRIENWGCKWDVDNISYTNQDNPIFMFETPWSAPFEIIKFLSDMFPECSFELEYADEDLGNNCGRVTYQNGSEYAFDEWHYDEAKELWDSISEDEFCVDDEF